MLNYYVNTNLLLWFQLKMLESQLEDEQDEKHSLLREKRDLETHLSDAASSVGPKRDAVKEKALKRDLKKTRALLRDAQTMVQNVKDKEGSRQIVKQLRNQVR